MRPTERLNALREATWRMLAIASGLRVWGGDVMFGDEEGDG